MRSPKLLDLFCCGGGAGWGYKLAGFEVTGIDIKPQLNYRAGEFIQFDAIEYLNTNYKNYDAIHASPPCQKFSSASKQWRKEGKEYADMIHATRRALRQTGLPYVIENVEAAPLVDWVLLCGSMFPGLKMYRHRKFESNHVLEVPEHLSHVAKQVKMGRAPKENEFIQMVGHFSGVPMARETTGLYWLNQYELAQCVPPQYTEYIGKQLIKIIQTAD